jgi:hypothetical protein
MLNVVDQDTPSILQPIMAVWLPIASSIALTTMIIGRFMSQASDGIELADPIRACEMVGQNGTTVCQMAEVPNFSPGTRMRIVMPMAFRMLENTAQDIGLAKAYEQALSRIRAQRAGIVMPKGPGNPGSQPPGLA